METAIATVALEVGIECLESGLLEKAQRAVHQGLMAVPFELSLWRLRLQVAAAMGPSALARAKAEAAAALDTDLISSLGELADS